MRDRWIEVTTVGDLLLRAASQTPGKDALVFPAERRTYAELEAGAWRVARGLHGLGVRKGDHVGILMVNCTDLVEAFFGIALLGAVVVPVNARYKAVELAYVIDNADLVALLTTDLVEDHVDFVALLRQSLPGLPDAPDPRALKISAAPRLRQVILQGRRTAAGTIGREEFAAIAGTVPAGVVESASEQVRVRDIAMVIYTSGTTANPKGCLYTHEGFVRVARAAGERWHVSGADVMWDALPMFHMSALVPLLFTLDAGGTFAAMTHFEAGAALRQMQETKATLIYPCFPPIMTALMNHPDFAATDLSRVRAMLNVAPVDTLRLMQRAVPHAPQIGSYGLTEGGGIVSYNDIVEDREQLENTVGRPLRGIQVRIVDPAGQDVPAGVPGEILVRGYGVMEGYYKDPQQTAQVLGPDGWLHTGDLCLVDAQGRISYLGRIKEMLKVGGENVSPAEIESYLSTHPAVKMAQALGIPDARLGEVPVALVELKPGTQATEQQIIDYCRGKIASYKVPRHVRFVTEWPMSATKIQRFRLRELISRELGTG